MATGLETGSPYKQGRFIRQISSFRHWITDNGQAGPMGSYSI